MVPDVDQDTMSDIDVPQQKQNWRYLALVMMAAIAGAALLAGSFNAKHVSLSTSSPQEVVGLEGKDCDCESARSEGMSKCPSFSWRYPGRRAVCVTNVLVAEKTCIADCATSTIDAAKKAATDGANSAKQAVDSAKKAATDGANSAKQAVDSAKKAATDGANSAKQAVDSAKKAATDGANSAKQAAGSAKKAATDGVGSTLAKGKDTVESVATEITTQHKCVTEFLDCCKKCGVKLPGNVANEASEDLENLDTHEIADDAKGCVKKCEDAQKRCTQD